jgi:purine nucleosidase
MFLKYSKIPTLFLLILLFQCISNGYSQKKQIILDADTANEVDDLFAIVRAATDSEVQLSVLNATHWQPAHWATAQTMEDSNRLNELLVSHLDIQNKTKTLRGAVNRMYDWGNLAQYSAAANEIVTQAKQNNKITVIALGALTNIASAIFIDPSIASNIELYWLGSEFDFDKNKMSKVDFNCMMDQRALDYLLNSKVEMHIIPVNVANSFDFSYDEVQKKLPTNTEVSKFLIDRWFHHIDGSRKNRILWDLALVEAFIHPELAEQVKVKTSIDSGNREIFYYKNIKSNAMKEDFFKSVTNYFSKK